MVRPDELPVSVAQNILDYVPYNEKILCNWKRFVGDKRYWEKIKLYNYFYEMAEYYDLLFYRVLEDYGVAIWRPQLDDAFFVEDQ